MRVFVIAICLFCSMQGIGQTVTTRTIQIEPHLSFQNYEHFKRLTLRSPDSDAEFVEGFDFEWGYEYVLKVDETRLASDLSDGTRYEYRLKEVVSKTAVVDSAQFRLFLDADVYYSPLEEGMDPSEGRTLKMINDSTFTYFEKVEIKVPTHLLELFESVYQGKKTGLGFFEHSDGNRIRLVGLRNY